MGRKGNGSTCWHRNVTVNLHGRDSMWLAFLGVAPRISTVGLLWPWRRGTRTSGLWCKRPRASWFQRTKVWAAKRILKASKTIYHTMFILQDLERSWQANDKMTGWMPKLTQQPVKQTPSALGSLSNDSKLSAVPLISTQLSARQPVSMI